MSTTADFIRMEEGDIKNLLETIEERRISSHKVLSWMTTFFLAFQSIGIAYGDFVTSPIHVFASTFHERIEHKDDVLGVLSIIYYSILSIPLIKYMLIVLKTCDNGKGGAFALYSLLCRHANVSLIPNQQRYIELSNCSNKSLKQKLENSHFARKFLLCMTILGTTMVISDAIFTPPMSNFTRIFYSFVYTVISAVNEAYPTLGQDGVVVVTIAILILLFSVQRFGVKVGYLFAPIITLWFILIGGIGFHNLFKYGFGILRAVNPKYIVGYFQRNGKKGWISLGGVFLCISGCEAMFADLGHFSVSAIQISFSVIVLPSLLATYTGQAAYLHKYPHTKSNLFYGCVPDPFYWPVYFLSVIVSVIASQSIISATFSVISQAVKMGCFPGVKVVHTSIAHEGQVYIPLINYMLMIACIGVTASFKTPEKLSNANGIAIVCDMAITTLLVSVVMMIISKKNVWKVAFFSLPFGCIESIYFSSLMVNFKEGGFLPLLYAVIFFGIVGIWFYGQKEKEKLEVKNHDISKFVNDMNMNRMPGIGILYSEFAEEIPLIFSHFIAKIPYIHSVVVLVSVKAMSISTVSLNDRFVFKQVEDREYKIFTCIVRRGYNDLIEDSVEFESQLVHYLKEFIRQESNIPQTEENAILVPHASSDSIQSLGIIENDIEFIEMAWKKGVVHMIGEIEIVANPNSSIVKKILIRAYNFLRRNIQERDELMAFLCKRILKVGMTCQL